MDNFILRNEAAKIAKKLVEIMKSDKSLDEVFHSLLDKKYTKYDMKVLSYLANALYDEGYTLESVNPFKLKKI